MTVPRSATVDPAATGWRPHHAQQALLARLAQPAPPVANCTFGYWISGPLLPDRLLAAYRSAAAGFDALRLCLDPATGRWQPSAEPRLTIRRVAAGTRTAALAAARRAAREPFDLAGPGPVGRVEILSAAADQWLVLESFDHALVDGWSLRLLHEAVAAGYRGQQLPVAGSYRALLALDPVERRERAHRYWQQAYRDFAPAVTAVEPAATEPGYRTLRLSAERVDTLRRASGGCRATVATALLAAHAHSAARHCGSGQLPVFITFDTRKPGERQIFGMLTSTVPVPVRHDWTLSLAGHLSALSRQLLTVREHLEIDLDQLIDAGAAPALGAVDRTAFVLQDQPLTPPELPGLTLAAVAMPDQHQAGGLTTVVHGEPDGGMVLGVRTPAGSVLHRHLDSFVRTVASCLDVLADGADRVVIGSDALLPAATRSVIAGLAQPSPPYDYRPVAPAILDRLAGSAAPAVFEDGRWHTGAELHAVVLDQLARLRRAGVRPGQSVLVDARPAVRRIACYLATLLAGAVYVPATGPAEELARRCDAVARLDGHQARPLGATASMVEEHVGPARDMRPDDPAYVIFTSGTTGSPRGVLVSHGALANLVWGEQPRFGLEAGSRLLLIAPPTADPWICHVSAGLLAGAALVVADPNGIDSLADLFERHRISHAFLPAPLLAELEPRSYPDLRLLGTAGDHARPTAVRPLLPHRIVNIYGPTEATVTAAVAELGPAELAASELTGRPLPIGRPIRGAGARVVIDGVASAPLGVLGELTLTGHGLATGYLGDPELTARRFRADPLRPGHRCYATGDLGWLDEDGRFYLAGRRDRQVKVRGFRVELGQLEHLALATGRCRDAHAVALPDPVSGDRHLILYVDGCPSPEDLAAQLRGRLPRQLVPRRVIGLERLPRLPSGVIEQSGLPPIQPVAPTAPATPLAPLGRAWCAVLGCPAPGGNFFELGGDSLDVLRLVRQARQAGLSLTPNEVYRHPDYAELSEHLGTDTAPPAGRVGGDRLIPLGPAQRWLLGLRLPQPNRWNQQHVIPFERLPQPAAVRDALDALLASTPILHAGLTPDGWRRQGAAPVSLEVVALPAADEVIRGLLDSLHAGFDPAAGELLHAGYLSTADGSGALVLAAHHLVVDDWSWQVIEDRLQAALGGQQLAPDDGFEWFAETVRRQQQAGAFYLDAEPWQRILDGGRVSRAGHRPARLTTATVLLTEAIQRWQLPMAAVLLAMLGHGLDRIEPGGHTVIDLERNGRTALADADLSGAVGWFALHHPVLVPHAPLAAATAAALAGQLAAVPAAGLSYTALATSLGSAGRTGRLSVNIAELPHRPAASPRLAGLLDQLRRCAVSAVGDNRLGYAGSLVFRLGAAGEVVLDGRFDPAQLAPADVDRLLAELASVRPAGPAAKPVPAAGPFTGPIPAGFMQELMLYAAVRHPGSYLPRQLLRLPVMGETAEPFLAELAELLCRLDPFGRTFRPGPTGLLQRYQRPAVTIERRAYPAAANYLGESDRLDPAAAMAGGELVRVVAFVAPGQPVLLGMQLHHAVLDGESNRQLLRLIGELAQRYRLAPEDRPARSDPARADALAVRRHVSAERSLLPGRTTEPPERQGPRWPAGCEEPAEPGLTGRSTTLVPAAGLRDWARRHGVDPRAAICGIALAAARWEAPGRPVYLVSNGRDSDLPETERALGMFWYFDRLVPGTTDPAVMAAEVFDRAGRPVRRLREAARDWRHWLDPAGLSVNVLGEQPAEAATVQVLGQTDEFHFDDQLQISLRATELVLRWTARHRPARTMPRPSLAGLLAGLGRIGAAVPPSAPHPLETP